MILPHSATATATLVNGFVVGENLTDGGNCYTNTPLVRIIGDGTGAQAVAVVSNGVVTAITPISAGSGYTTAIIVIEPPFIPNPTMAIAAITFGALVTPVIQLNFGNLAPYDKYQIEFSPVAKATWSNVGNPFIPTSANSTQFINATGNEGFFRVKYVP